MFTNVLRRMDLVDWAVHDEVDNAGTMRVYIEPWTHSYIAIFGDVFRGDNLAMKILSLQLFGTLGKKYLSLVLLPLVKGLLGCKDSLEVSTNIFPAIIAHIVFYPFLE
jgi:hypothetical protein